MKTRWATGVFLGIRDESQEVFIGTDEGVIKVRDVMRQVGMRSWDVESLKLIKGTPRRPHHDSEDDQIDAKPAKDWLWPGENEDEISMMRKIIMMMMMMTWPGLFCGLG